VKSPNIPAMDSRVVQLPKRAPSAPRRQPVSSAESPPRTRGRAWINGREVGGVDPRFAHLSASYD
jgi:hypothetical protein